jgi:hypothetical protein
MRVAYLWSSGEIRSKSYASSYWALDPPATIEKGSNNGDLFVTEASLRLTAPEVVECFDPARFSERAEKLVNSNFDVVFVRGANTLSDEAYASSLADCLERIKIKVVIMGIGIQAPSLSKMPKNKDLQRLAGLLGDHAEAVGVRGAITAEFLEGFGVKNVQIVGCPSILRHNNPDLRLHKPEWSELRNFGFSLTRYCSPIYQRDKNAYLALQSRLIKELHGIGRVGILSQVEREEKAFAFRDPATLENAAQELRRSGWFDDTMEEIYRTRSIFFGTSGAAYDMQVRNFDVVMGTRLHANAMAVACGIPAITFTSDLRVQEIYDFWKLPSMKVEEAGKLSARDIYDSADFDPFNQRIGFIYDNFRSYLETNGVAHKMKPQA